VLLRSIRIPVLAVDAAGRGVGVTSGAAMSQGNLWIPQQATETIYRILFPSSVAMTRSRELFKGWVPPAAPSREEPKAAVFSLSDFTGSVSKASALKPYTGEDDAEPVRTASKKAPAKTETAAPATSQFLAASEKKKRRGKRDDDSD
jgi:hypothetical protein